MGLFKPNIEKLKKRGDFNGLLKILQSGETDMHMIAVEAIIDNTSDERKNILLEALKHEDLAVRNKVAIALAEYSSKEVIDALIQSIEDTDEALKSLMKINNRDAIKPLADHMLSMKYWNKTKIFFSLMRDFGSKNKIVSGIAKELGFPAIYKKSSTFYEGKSVNQLFKKLPDAMDWIPELSHDLILQEYEVLKNKTGLFAYNPRGLHGGLTAESKKAIKAQLDADSKWLSAPKVKFLLIASGWNAVITTYYIRPPANLSFWTTIWRSSNDDSKPMYYYTFSERNW